MLAKNQTFSDMAVVIDGSSFYNCTFNRCKMIFAGMLPATLDSPTFNDCQWEFTPPASNAIAFMTAIYKMGGAELIENTFRAIRGDQPVPAPKAQH
jgi:hypothetical protein